MSTNSNVDAPVIIIGGGPGGASVGAYLSLAGIENVIFERDTFPRFHVGESLVPATTARFREIGFLEKLDQSRFVRKPGAVWLPKSGRNSYKLRFAPDPYGRDYSFHVDRPVFDQMLLEHAASLGSRVEEETAVANVIMNGDRVTGVEIQRGTNTREVRASFVVDASGRRTFLGSRFKLKEKDPLFNQFAIFGHFKGFDLGPEDTSNYIHIIFLPTPRGWVWQIPVNDEITSVGVVTERADFHKDGRDRARYFNRHISSNPELSRRFEKARAATGLVAEGDYSYSMRKLVGPGYLLIGDAARFVDPIFSSGVSVAMTSAKFASEAIVKVLSGAMPEDEALGLYESRVKNGVKIWYEFIKIYYKLQNLFTLYIQKPEYRKDLELLLQGEVFDRASVPVLDKLREDIRAIEASDRHIMKEALTDIPL